jgi:NADP-dependent aldehyde dehydrogenase
LARVDRRRSDAALIGAGKRERVGRLTVGFVNAVVSKNPATGETFALTRRESSVGDTLELTARAASIAREFARLPRPWRADLLNAMADELEADASSLVAVAQRETALTLTRLESELRRTVFQLRFFAEVVLEGSFLQVSVDHATDSPMGPLPDLRRMRVPIGPVAIFGSSNFPFAFSVPGGDTASALAAGCPVVIKAHPAHPATSLATFEALVRAARTLKAPDGLLAMVFGVEAGVALVEAPEISAVGFTGSTSGGQFLWRLANDRAAPIPFFGELGAANPLVVTTAAADARPQAIGEGVAASMTLGAGQFCTKPGLLFVPSSGGGDELVGALATKLRTIAPMTMLSDDIASQFRASVEAYVGVADITHTVANTSRGPAQAGGQLFELSAKTFIDSSQEHLRRECFGPLSLVVRYDDISELAASLEVTEPSLTFSVFSGVSDEDVAWLIEFATSRAGRVIVDEFPTGVGVSWSMQHGGPWPAGTSPSATSVGAAGIERWLRPVTYQNVPDELLPVELRDVNRVGIPRRVDGALGQ